MKAKLLVVLGAGESGVGSAILAEKKGYDVFVSDMSTIKDQYRKILEENGWNQTKTAKVLGIQRTYVVRLINELNIRVNKV